MAATTSGETRRKLEGKVAVITGGSTGIGLGAAIRFVAEGAYVFITGRRQAELDKAVSKIGKDVLAVQGDIAHLDDLDQLYHTVETTGRRIDVLIANAGHVELATLAQATPEHFDRTWRINARGTFFTVQKALPLLNPGASIVLVSSAVHHKGFPPYAVYAATKAAIRSFSRSFAVELKDRGIRVNTLSPGPVDTPIIEAQFSTKEEADASKAGFSSLAPLGRIGTVEEMASALLFLASGESSFCTGIELVADAGFTQV